jgi:hypothetical protein
MVVLLKTHSLLFNFFDTVFALCGFPHLSNICYW